VNQRDQQQRAQEKAAAEQQRAAAERTQAEADRRRTAATAALSVARGADATISAILAHADDIPDHAGKAAWLQLVASRALTPTHDIVTAIGLRHLFYDSDDAGRNWREVSRDAAWYAPAVVLDNGTSSDRWLDSHGAIWIAALSQNLRLYVGGTPQTYPIGRKARGEPNWIALPRGETFRTSLREPPWIHVPGGVRLAPQPANNDYAKVIATILHSC
jgi:hypothetical protein